MEKNKKYTQGVEDVERVLDELKRQEVLKQKGTTHRDPNLNEDKDDDVT